MAGPAVPIRGNALIPRAADNDVRRLATPIVMAGHDAAGAASRGSGIFGAWYYAGQQAAPVPARNATNLATPRTTEGHGARVAAPADRELRALRACPRSSVLESRCVALGQEIAGFPPAADQAGGRSRCCAPHDLRLPQRDRVAADCPAALGDVLAMRRIAPARRARHRQLVPHAARQHLRQRPEPSGARPPARNLGPLRGSSHQGEGEDSVAWLLVGSVHQFTCLPPPRHPRRPGGDIIGGVAEPHAPIPAAHETPPAVTMTAQSASVASRAMDRVLTQHETRRP